MELPPIVTIGLYATIALFNIISLGLLAYAVNSWRGYYFGLRYRSSSPSSVNFMLFNTIWTLLALVYLVVVPRVAAALYFSVAALGLLAVTTIFWFAGSIALAAYLGVSDCDGGSFCGVYRASQAATAFGFFIWIMLTVLLVVEALRFFKHGIKGRANADASDTQMTSQTEPQAPAPAVA